MFEKVKKTILALIICAGMIACTHNNNGSDDPKPKPEPKNVVVPSFDGQKAYDYVKQQTDFGPRVAGTAQHDSCGTWLAQVLSGFADTVYVQNFRTRLYTGKGIDGNNIIASFNPKASKRIVLCSHWDSRPFADHDSDENNHNTPIDGANDGASGVGILLALAEVMHNTPIDEKLGIDIVFFDLEDYGPPQSESERYFDENNYWALGSQYWSAQPHIAGYRANFGILLDMVGAKSPNFTKEYFSQRYASFVGNKIWRIARDLGYENYFTNASGDPVSDDHLPMNEVAGIPTYDIIDLRTDSSNGTFPEMWHTVNDNIDCIDVNTLQMVGNVLTHLIYNE